MSKISLGLLATGALLVGTAWQGYSQQQWINQQNRAIALSTATHPRQHSSPLWPILGLGGLGALGVGAIGLREGGLPIAPTGAAKPLPTTEFNAVPVAQTGGDRVTQIHPISVEKNHNSNSTDWLKTFLESAYHVSLNGATRSGKTTLCEWGISQLGDGEIYLIDPKYNPQKPRWNYTPSCTDIDEVPMHLEQLANRIKKRLAGEEAIADLNVIVDEWDWIFEEFGKSAIRPLRKLFKVGAELGIKVWLLGQSPLAKDTGLSGSDYRNFGRIVLTAEALSFINNQQFPWDSSQYKPLAESHQKKGDRFGLFVPMSGQPFLKPIPDFSQFSPVQSYQLESLPHPPERSEETPERLDHEWLNALLDKPSSGSERSERWEPRDPLNDSEPSPEAIGMVVSLHRSGCSKQECIEYTWRCKKGGSKAYKLAESFYQQTLQNLGVF